MTTHIKGYHFGIQRILIGISAPGGFYVLKCSVRLTLTSLEQNTKISLYNKILQGSSDVRINLEISSDHEQSSKDLTGEL